MPLPLPLSRGHHIRTLPNGLTAIVAEDFTHPVASVQIWCGSGSAHESPLLGSGSAHFVEHMLFKGTHKRHYSEIAREIQNAGGSVNAYTTFDRTVYYVNGAAEGALTWLDVLGDMAANSSFPEAEFAKEQEVIRREFAMGNDDPDHILSEMTFSTAFQKHPMRHPIIGHLDVFNTLTREDLVEFHRTRYAPENLFVVVAGAVKASAVFQKVEKLFGSMRRVGENPPAIPAEPPPCGRRELRRSFDTQVTRLSMVWHAPGLGLPGHTALSMLASTLGGGESSRLWSSLREEQSLAEQIHAYLYTPGQLGLFFVDAECLPEHADRLIDGIRTQIHLLAGTGPTPEELEKIRRRAMAGIFGRMTTASGQAGDLGIGWHLARNPLLSRENLDRILQITSEEIQEAAKTFLKDDLLSLTVLGPEGKSRPKSSSRRARAGGTVERHVLPCGTPLLLVQDPRIPMMQVQGSFRGGLLADPKGKAGLNRLVSSVWSKGAGDRDAAEIAEQIENLGGSLHTDSGNNSLSLAASGFSTDRDFLLDLFADVALRPHWEEAQMEREKEAQLTQIAEIDDNPVSVAIREMRSRMFTGHALASPVLGLADDVSSLTREDVTRTAAKLIQPANGGIAVSGSFEPAALLEGLSERFQNWKPFKAPSLLPPSALKKSSRHVLAHQKEQSIIVTGFQLPGLDSPDRVAFAMLDEACSDMSSRLFTKIREEMGLAYFVGAGILAGLTGGAFYFYLGTSPEKAGEVEDVLRQEIALLASDGLEPEEIERAKRTFLGKMASSRQKPGSVAFESLLDEIFGFGYMRHEETESLVKACDKERLDPVAARLFTQPSITVVAGPA